MFDDKVRQQVSVTFCKKFSVSRDVNIITFVRG